MNFINKFISAVLLIAVLLISCRPILSRPAKLSKERYTDTISFETINTGHLVIPVTINNSNKRLVFDTGAGKSLLSASGIRKSRRKILVRDIFGKFHLVNIGVIDNLRISRLNYEEVYSIIGTLPVAFQVDGLMGYNIIKASNWHITKNSIIASDTPFSIKQKLTLPLVEKGSALHIKLSFNKNAPETFLVDYGGDFDIELSDKFYNKYKTSFSSAVVRQSKKSSYGAFNRKDQSVRKLKCNIDFEGIQIPNVQITVIKGIENRLGVVFLSRFKEIALNSTVKKMSFGALR